jgi:hypothetical protein
VNVHDKKLITLPLANALSGAELVYCVQDGFDRGFPVSTLAAFTTGDVHGPAPGTSTDNHIARWNGATGKLLKDSSVEIDDNGVVSNGKNVPGGFMGFIANQQSGVFGSLGGYYAGSGQPPLADFNLYAAQDSLNATYLESFHGHVVIQLDDLGKNLFLKTNSGAVIVSSCPLWETEVALTDGATVPLNAMLGTVFRLTALGNRTILAPTGLPTSALTQKIIIAHAASGGSRSLTLTTGSSNSFRFGTTIPNLTATLSGTTDYIGCVWNGGANRWDVVSYSKGF